LEYLVEFELRIPDGTADSVVDSRVAAEATAAANLAEQGHLIRLWKKPEDSRAIGLFRAKNKAEIDALLADLPLYDWLRVTITGLQRHPNDPRVSKQANDE
jgi:muconolactone delta-isomerase